MVGVFDSVIGQLRGLSTYEAMSGISAKVLYILASLSTVKSCVLPIILAQNGEPGADEVAVSMFDSILTSIRPDQSDESKYKTGLTSMNTYIYFHSTDCHEYLPLHSLN